MKVAQLIEELSKFPADTEVLITDGFKGNCYEGDFKVQKWLTDGKVCVDIGIGGCLEDDLTDLKGFS